MKIGIINSGGDCPGLNAVIASVVKSGTQKGIEFVGYYKGWEGILDEKFTNLTKAKVRGITYLGGTILKTVNRGRFPGRVGEGELSNLEQAVLEEVKSKLKQNGVDALIVVGGDGTLGGAYQLSKFGVDIVGVPKSIDNDLSSTDMTFGFSSAVDIVVESLDRIHTTATSHERVIIAETMGRSAGWIALYSGIAGSANMILLPEIPFTNHGVLEQLKARRREGRYSSVIVIAEGAHPKDEKISATTAEGRPEVLYAGAAQKLATAIESMPHGNIEVRTVVLGHVQRGGSPNAQDRLLAQRYGVAAVNAVMNKDFGKMIAFKNNQITTIPLETAVKKVKKVSKNDPMIKTAQELGIYLGDLD